MTPKKRRKLFYLCLFFFLALSPLLVFYALGYAFDFSRKTVLQNGGIFLKSRQAAVSVFLNGELVKETSVLGGGALLSSVRPGSYLLRVEKEGYQSWSKIAEVKPSLVTEIRNVVLVKQPPVYRDAGKKISGILAEKKPSADLEIDKKGNLVKKGRPAKNLSAAVDSFAVFENRVFFVNKSGFLARLDLVSENIDTLGRPGFFLGEQPFRFIESPIGEVAIIDSSGGLFLYDVSGEVKAVDGGVADASFDSSGAKMLIVKEKSVSILWRKNSAYQPFQPAGTKETVIQLDSRAPEARWFYKDNAHVVIRVPEGIFFTELDGRGGRNTVELVSGKTDELFTNPEFADIVFFRKGKLWQEIEL